MTHISLAVWPDASRAVEQIRYAECAGVERVWMTQGVPAADALTLLAAAAAGTDRIELGTAILPVPVRHPVVLAQQALTLAQLSGGRFSLGLGLGNPGVQRSVFGVDAGPPLAHLREYVEVLRPLLAGEAVDHHGERYTVTVQLPAAAAVPVLLSALGPQAFALAGELTDGAISWMCPPGYLVETALPALRKQAARPEPRLVAHVPVALTADRGAAVAAARPVLGYFGSIPVYRRMFAAAGYPFDGDRAPDALFDALLVSGDPSAVADQLRGLADMGLDEILVGPVAVRDADAEFRELAALVGAQTVRGQAAMPGRS